MKKTFIIVKTTCANLSKAKKLAKILLQGKLAACVQLSAIESLYFWQKKIVNSAEISLSIKTKKSNYKKIKKIILQNHDYEIPQILAIEINQGLEEYLNWIDTNTK
jgi:periplasmic divalent cation tolerance protein